MSGKLPSYPSRKLTLTFTSHFGQDDGVGRGRWAFSRNLNPTNLANISAGDVHMHVSSLEH